jgi:periplasmic protein CpxP/Spy
MNEKVPAIWKWAVILLLLCNLGLILTMWLKPAMHNGPHGETPRDYAIRNLKFNDEQAKKYDVLIKAHQEAMHRLRHEAMEYRQQLFTNLGNAQSGLNTDSLAQLIANNQKQIEVTTYDHFAQVRLICTDAQKTEFDKIIGDVIKKMNGPGGPPPHDGQGPPPDDRNGPPPPPESR